MGDGEHVVEHVAGVAVGDGKGARCQLLLDAVEDAAIEVGAGGVHDRAVLVVIEAFAALIDSVVLLDLVPPIVLGSAVDLEAVGVMAAGVTVQRHVGVGDVVAEREEEQGDVVAGGGDGGALVFAVLDLEVVDDGVGQGFAAFGQVVVRVEVEEVGVDVLRAGELLQQGVGGQGHASGLAVGAVQRGGGVLHDVAGGVVFVDRVWVPGALDDAVFVLVKEFHQAGGGLPFVGVEPVARQTFDRLAGDPGVSVLVHMIPFAEHVTQ